MEEETTVTEETTAECAASDSVSGINSAQVPTKQHFTFAPEEAHQTNRINDKAGPFIAQFLFGALSTTVHPCLPGLKPPFKVGITPR